MGKGKRENVIFFGKYIPLLGEGGNNWTKDNPCHDSYNWYLGLVVQGPAASNVTDRVYGVIDLYGQAAQVHGGIKQCKI